MIAEASRHAILLSSVHRSLSPHSVAETDFADFARELLENSVRAAGMPFIAVEVRGDQLQLPSDRAASLAILLFEWTRLAIPGLVQARNPRLAIAHEARADTQILSLSALGWSGESTELAEHELSRQIVTAMADHLGGYLEMSDEGGILRFGLRFPLSPEQPLQGSMPEPMIWAQTTPTLQ
jgi:two-component sensor histidine kinase